MKNYNLYNFKSQEKHQKVTKNTKKLRTDFSKLT